MSNPKEITCDFSTWSSLNWGEAETCTMPEGSAYANEQVDRRGLLQTGNYAGQKILNCDDDNLAKFHQTSPAATVESEELNKIQAFMRWTKDSGQLVLDSNSTSAGTFCVKMNQKDWMKNRIEVLIQNQGQCRDLFSGTDEQKNSKCSELVD